MTPLPKVITSSVIRSAHQGESHGGLYIVDCETGCYEQVLDWNDSSINWEGRGLDRGLRGIAFYDNKILLAASEEIFLYDQNFNLLESYRNKYLRHCHEIFVQEDSLFLTSTGYDSILEFNLKAKRFVKGYCLRYNGFKGTQRRRFLKKLYEKMQVTVKPSFSVFDPNLDKGPLPGDTVHLNNVYCTDEAVYISGSLLNALWCVKENSLTSYAQVPFTTHNVRPFREGLLLNSTASDQIVYISYEGEILEVFNIKRYNEQILLRTSLPQDHARQSFGRGLCLYGDDLIIGGSSPATISLYQFGAGSSALKTVNITMDVRNSIHGLEIWPY